jgi:cell fate regulator YaaT (PSP1 superfamily)
MGKIVGVQFREGGKVYSFDAGHFVLHKGSRVLVETERGTAYGEVCTEPKNLGTSETERPLQKIARLATEEDKERHLRGCTMEKEVYAYCFRRTKERDLPMSLVAVERLLDGSKTIVYFSADGRVDFRDLVKDLVKRFRTRIEMRQIGVRHQAKMVGGLGNCGRQLCCSSFLRRFEPVSIKMAKGQNLSLNPSKISGMCGRLMCCLTYEHAFYSKVKKGIPKMGKRVETIHGKGKVIRQNVLKETLTIQLESGEEKELTFEELLKEKKGKKEFTQKKAKGHQ